MFPIIHRSPRRARRGGQRYGWGKATARLKFSSTSNASPTTVTPDARQRLLLRFVFGTMNIGYAYALRCARSARWCARARALLGD